MGSIKTILCISLCLLAFTSFSQWRCNIEAGGSNLAGFGVNVEYGISISKESKMLLIPKLGIGHNFMDPALLVQAGLSIATPLKSNFLKFSSDIGLTIESPFFRDENRSGDLFNSTYDTGEALFWHIGWDYEWTFEKTHLSVGLGPFFETTRPFQNYRSTDLVVKVWPKISFGF